MFVGSVFSPRYAREGGEPRKHVAINLAFYRLDGGPSTWVFAEHDGRSSPRSPGHLAVGDSHLTRDAAGLTIDFDELTSPFPRPERPRRLQGSLRLRGDLRMPGLPIALDEQGEHRWWPVQPQADLEVDVPALGLRWRGVGYHDANDGLAPLASAFRCWSWGRFHHGDRTLLVYDTEPLRGPARSVALCLEDGQFRALPTPALHPLGRGAWGLARRAPADPGAPPPRILHTLEDSPFYGRHIVETTLEGERLRGFCEVLSAERFARPWVRFLLPFRMRFAR